MPKLALVFVLSLALLAALALAARFFIPQFDFYHRSVVSQLEALTGAQVELGELRIGIHDFHLAFSLRQVVFSDPERPDEKAYSERLHIGISPLDSLLQRRPAVAFISFDQAALSLQREASSVRLIGAPALAKPAPGGKDATRRFRLTQSSIVWNDLSHQKQLSFSLVDVDLLSRGQSHSLSFSSLVEGEEQAAIRLRAEFRGELFSPASWSGQLTADTQGLIAIAPWSPYFKPTKLESGGLSFSAEAELQSGRLLEAGGFVWCGQCRHSSENVPQSVDFSARWQWLNPTTGQQSFSLKNIQLDAEPLLIENSQLLLSRNRHGQSRLDMEIPAMNARTIAWFNRYFPASWSCGEACLSAQSLSLKARLHKHNETFPAHSFYKDQGGVAGWLAGFARADSLTAEVTAEELTFHAPWWDNYRPHASAMSVAVHAELSSKTRRISAHNIGLAKRDGGQIQGHVSYALKAGQQPALSMDLRMRDWSSDAALDALSLKRLPPRLSKLKRWLHASVLDGKIKHGHIRLEGNPARYPFSDGGGRLRVEMDVEEGLFSYQNRYPGDVHSLKAHTLLNNGSLTVEASQLRYQGMYARRAVIKIPSVFDLLVGIELDGHAELPAILAFLRQENILKKDGLISPDVLVAGKSDFDLLIEAAPERPEKKIVSLNGRLRPQQAAVTIPDLGFTLSEINGELAFNQSGSLPSSLSASLNETPVDLSIEPQDGFNLIGLKGRLAIADLAPGLATKLSTYSSGASDWHIELRLPALTKASKENGNRRFQLQASSSLEGTALSMPSPFAKSTQSQGLVRLLARYDKDEFFYDLAYKDRVRAQFGAKKDAPHYTGHVHFGGEPARLPDEGFKISGAIRDTVDVQAWRAFLSAAADYAEHPSWRYHLSDVRVFFKRLQWGHHQWHELSADATMQGNRVWVLRLHGDGLNGAFYVPPSQDPVPILARFEQLRLHQAEDTAGHRSLASADFDPSSLPALRLEFDELSYGDIRVQKLKARTEPLAETMLLKQLRFHAGNMIVRADLNKANDWRKRGGQSTTRFSFSVYGDDLGATLKSWNIRTGISNEESVLRGEIAWPGAPYDFSPASLNGTIDLRLRDGVLQKIEPGVGRLFGLFNIASITRRVSLDFSDLFNRGLGFDSMAGTLQFAGGAMSINDFLILGPAMQLSVSGRTDIINRSYDQDIYVVPDLSENLPVLSALLGGPLVGATVYLVDRLTNLGDAINKTVTLQYKMSGSWDDPKIKFVDAPKINPVRLIPFSGQTGTQP